MLSQRIPARQPDHAGLFQNLIDLSQGQPVVQNRQRLKMKSRGGKHVHDLPGIFFIHFGLVK